MIINVDTLLHHPHIRHYQMLIEQALEEDAGQGDLTSIIFIDSAKTATFHIIAREAGILCGSIIAQAVCKTVSPAIEVVMHYQDGKAVNAGDIILSMSGYAQQLLVAERICLNFLSYLSGIATATAACVNAVHGTKAQILDTRKTLPAYRHLAKYAVRCGGGRNHRLHLGDGVMVKDNHIALCGSLADAVAQARMHTPMLTRIEVECDTFSQVEAALHAGADMIMLDNMNLEDMRRAVDFVAGRVALEASGNVTLERLPAIAATGVDYISLGSLTHSVKALDFGMDHTDNR